MKSDMLPSRRAVFVGLAAGLALGQPVRAESPPTIAVTKDPSCGCCAKWVEHLRRAGFTVTVTEGPVTPVKARLGVPRDLAACHIALVDGYVVEGHVPADAIKRLLAERLKGTGLAVPGMPAGSPGMELEGRGADTYEVVLFGPAGRGTFARYRGGEPA